MSFTRIQDREREAREQAWNRYVALLQLENGDDATEAELRTLGNTLQKDSSQRAADRKAIARARAL